MSKEEFPHEKDLKDEVTPDQAKEKTASKKKTVEAEAAKPKEADNSAELEQKIDALSAKNKELEDKYLRSEAELQNMQARYAKERAQLIKYESQSLAKDVLPAMDNLERALAVKADDEASKQLQKGVQMTLDALVKAMNDHGITEVEAEGQKFDPTVHQAVQTIAADDTHEKDQVVQVLQKGYKYKDRTLRPAMVVVAQ